MNDFKKLAVWNKSHDLTLKIYRLTANYPREELYGLTSQMRRSSASIPTNIAEGFGRSGDRERARYLEIAMGSANELEYHLILSRDLELLNESEFGMMNRDVVEVRRMMTSLRKTLKAGS